MTRCQDERDSVMTEIALAMQALQQAVDAKNDVQSYQALRSVQKHVEEAIDNIKHIAAHGKATPDLVANKELGVSKSDVQRYSINAIKAKFGEKRLAFALTVSSQTTVRVRNIKGVKDGAGRPKAKRDLRVKHKPQPIEHSDTFAIATAMLRGEL